MQQKSFNPDVNDGSGWTPLMIASSLKEGDSLVNMLLQKGADVNAKSTPLPSLYMLLPPSPSSSSRPFVSKQPLRALLPHNVPF